MNTLVFTPMPRARAVAAASVKESACDLRVTLPPSRSRTFDARNRQKFAGGAESGYCNVKFTVTDIITSIGSPFNSVGVNCHWRTASIAASSRRGIDLIT